MKNADNPQDKFTQKILATLPAAFIEEVAVASGFKQRNGARITALPLLLAFFSCIREHLYSLSRWAKATALIRAQLGGTLLTLSKQAIWERLSSRSTQMVSLLLQKVLWQRLQAAERQGAAAPLGSLPFGRILFQDSTTLSLQNAPQLCEAFKGPKNQHNGDGAAYATARLQCIGDLKAQQLLHFELGSFTDNDQGAAPQAEQIAREGDLLLRDQGYWSLSSIQKLLEKGVHLVLRLRYGVRLYWNRHDTEAIDLKTLYQKAKCSKEGFSCWVYVGSKQRVRLRVVLIALPDKVADERVRKAKADRDRRLKHSPDYYTFMRFTLLLTTTEEAVVTNQMCVQLYRLRWYVELFFRGLKSGGLHVDKFCSGVRCKVEHVRTIVLLCCLYVALLLRIIWPLCKEQSTEHLGGEKQAEDALSLLKVMALLCSEQLLQLLQTTEDEQQINRWIRYYTKYEKRNKRDNFQQRKQNIIILP